MKSEEITIRVDPETAQAYRAVSDEMRRKLDLLLSLRLNEAIHSDRSLQSVMEEIGRKAQARGMTPEVLRSLLDER